MQTVKTINGDAEEMADLPKERIEPSPSFTYCGIDCFDPFIVKQCLKEMKRYGLLYTCMCTRIMTRDVFAVLSPLEESYDNCPQTKELTSFEQRTSLKMLRTKKEYVQSW